MDIAKRMLDYDMHAPTTYFPLLIPECLLIEPTETESKQTIDQAVNNMANILSEAKDNPEIECVISVPNASKTRIYIMYIQWGLGSIPALF